MSEFPVGNAVSKDVGEAAESGTWIYSLISFQYIVLLNDVPIELIGLPARW